MEHQRRVVVYGHSVVLGAVQASLRRNPQFEVTVLAPPATASELTALAPDVILFDNGSEAPRPELDLLRACPGVLAIGIDPDTNRVFVWSGQQLHELSTQDLIHLIERHDR